MGNRREEIRLAEFMPESFKERCPCCKQNWVFEEVYFYSYRTKISCLNTPYDKPTCFSFSETQHFVSSQMDIAWQKLWRSLVQDKGLQNAIKLCIIGVS